MDDLLSQILDNIKNNMDEKEFYTICNKEIHLGVFTEPCLTYMLDGKKTIESRFSKNKILPYEKISENAVVFVKKSGGDVVAYFTIKKIMFINLEEVSIEDIKNKYNEFLCVDDEFWNSKTNSRYATLIFIDHLVKIKPFSIRKKGMQTWIKLS